MIKFERPEDELIGIDYLTGDTYILYIRKMWASPEKEAKDVEFKYANSFAQKKAEKLNYEDYDIKPIKNSTFYGADLYTHFSVTFKKDIKKEFKF